MKWRVQPQTSVVNCKQPSLEMLYIFFRPFFCSSCFFCLRASTEEYKHMHLRFFVHLMFLLWRSFFFAFSSEQVWFFMFFLDVSDSWLHLMFQVFWFFKWRVQPQTSDLNRKKPSLEMLYIFFWAFFCSSCFFCLQAWSPDYQHMHLSFVHVVICFYFLCFSILSLTFSQLFVFSSHCHFPFFTTFEIF